MGSKAKMTRMVEINIRVIISVKMHTALPATYHAYQKPLCKGRITLVADLFYQTEGRYAPRIIRFLDAIYRSPQLSGSPQQKFDILQGYRTRRHLRKRMSPLSCLKRKYDYLCSVIRL